GLQWIDLKATLDENKTNPHFDLKDYLLTRCKEAIQSGKKACLFSNSGEVKDELRFDSTDKSERLSIPVLFVKNPVADQRISFTVELTEKRRTGHNVIGYINNQAAQTIVLGAHYDHLGYGEDHNSLYVGKTPQIHNGADDNASGTAALMELARMIEKGSLKKYNFLIAAFSGEELGLYGSKYLVEHFPLDIHTVNCMINMDMVGRLNDSTHGITIGGYGTSASWGELVPVKDGYFNIKVDSAGVGPSDHTSFYRKDVPVLFFFTGTHMDYHKPSDDAEKINYSGEWQIVQYIYGLLEKINERGKLPFSKTKETTGGKASFKVSLGIMPDYTFSGSGVLVDGVSEGKAAQKAGIQVGDVLTQLGSHPFSDVQQYMQALSKFSKGETTTVTVKRGNETLQISITF
ncbi:MAG TPA: M28 family peptidase, partial [Ferruginibacter sp.]|nr:M28 family peptidase [Ferruginibacter sp.]